MMVNTKYNGRIDFESYREYCINNIYKILPLMEKNQEWESHLEGFLVELSGIQSLIGVREFTSLIAKLEGLFNLVENGKVVNRRLFRKIVLDSISLMKSIDVGDE